MTGSERYSRLKFAIHKIEFSTREELFQLIPGLRRYFNRIEWKEDENSGEEVSNTVPVYPEAFLCKIIRYIVFLYDENTGLTDDYPDDYRLRKDAAAKDAGFRRRDNGEWPAQLQDIMDLKDQHAVQWILDFRKVQKSPVWREIIVVEEELDAISRRRMEAVNDFTKKDDLMGSAKARNDERIELYKKFYADHDELKRATEKEIIPISPENCFIQLDLPDSITKVRQIGDVSTSPGV